MNWLQTWLDNRPCWQEYLLSFFFFLVLAIVFLWKAVLVPGNEFLAADVVNFYPPNRSLSSNPEIHNSIVADNMMVYYPNHWQTWDAIQHGSWPRFNPYRLAGSPANGLSPGYFLLQLPGFLAAWVTGELATSFTVSAVFHLALAGSFMYLLLRSWKVSPVGSLLGGILWTFAQHQIVWLHFPAHLQSQLLIPLMLYCFDQLFERPNWWRSSVFGAVLGFWWTVGYQQATIYSLLLLGVYFWFRIWQGQYWKKITESMSRIGYFLGALLFFFLISGHSILGTAQTISSGIRGTQTASFAPDCDICSLQGIAESTALFLQPNWFGNHVAHPYSGPRNLVEMGRYMTWLPFLMIAIGLWRYRKRSRAVFFTTVAAVAFGIMEGVPLLSDAFYAIPFLQLGQPSRLITVVLLGTVLATALWFDDVIKWLLETKFRSFKFFIGVSATIAVGLLVLLFWWQPTSLQDIYTALQWWFPFFEATDGRFFILQAVTIPILMAVYLGWFFFSKNKFVSATMAQVILLGIVTAELFFFLIPFNTTVAGETILPETEMSSLLDELNSGTGGRVLPVGQIFLPNSNVAYEIPLLTGYSTVIDQGFYDQLQNSNSEFSSTYNGYVTLGPETAAFTDTLNVRYLVSQEPQSLESTTLLAEANNLYLYEITTAAPHVTVENGSVENIQYWRDGVTGWIETQEATTLRFAERFYPGWELVLETTGQKLEPKSSQFNTLQFNIPKTESTFSLQYRPDYSFRFLAISGWMLVGSLSLLRYWRSKDNSVLFFIAFSIVMSIITALPLFLTSRIPL